ncbi:PREDICTED: uncharacterized protein LOC106808766 [Priapulus caudatus]|uniref:Uncharacterized protein LOC106808766 n=1 Tax=Priapulus caudatus TaxID=37621 RepID=A0ABM1E4H7_PRICU|nr:PREDICTED: uncharacterized protein LOC106808766 [Priapulus caudatus]
MGLVDADYMFLWIDVGGHGHMSDAQIFNDSELNECLVDGTICLPPADPLPNDDRDMPYFFLADDAFAMRTNMMKPYSMRKMTKEHRIYNYRISRRRRVVENAFGILAQRWQILLTTMQHEPDTIRLIVEACVCLHNLMRLHYPTIQNAALDAEDVNHQLIPGAWRTDANMHELNNIRGNNRDTSVAKKQREYLKLYFNSPAGSAVLELFGGLKIKITGTSLQPDQPAIMIMNHRTCFDWLFLWACLVRQTKVRQEKIVLKSELKALVGPNWGMQAAFYIFVRQGLEADQRLMRRMTAYLSQIQSIHPQVLLFPEGTDFNVKAVASSDRHARQSGLPPYKYVLHPRTGGFVCLVQAFRQHGTLTAVHDMTIAYRGNFPESELDMIRGKFPEEVHVHISTFPDDILPLDDSGLQTWCKSRWQKKETRLQSFYRDNSSLLQNQQTSLSTASAYETKLLQNEAVHDENSHSTPPAAAARTSLPQNNSSNGLAPTINGDKHAGTNSPALGIPAGEIHPAKACTFKDYDNNITSLYPSDEPRDIALLLYVAFFTWSGMLSFWLWLLIMCPLARWYVLFTCLTMGAVQFYAGGLAEFEMLVYEKLTGKQLG